MAEIKGVKANKLTGNNKSIVLSDMLSDSIEYKNRRSAQLICDPKSIPIFSIISLHRDPKNIQICFLHINLHHAIVE